MAVTLSLDSPVTQTYMAHAALLAVKLLALNPLAAATWIRNGVFPNPDIVRRAYLSELKNLAPFWFIGGLYITTCPPNNLTISLFRTFTVSRLVIIFGYASKPAPAVFRDLAIVVSYAITCYMALYVLVFYRNGI